MQILKCECCRGWCRTNESGAVWKRSFRFKTILNINHQAGLNKTQRLSFLVKISLSVQLNCYRGSVTVQLQNQIPLEGSQDPDRPRSSGRQDQLTGGKSVDTNLQNKIKYDPVGESAPPHTSHKHIHTHTTDRICCKGFIKHQLTLFFNNRNLLSNKTSAQMYSLCKHSYMIRINDSYLLIMALSWFLMM